MIIYRILNTLSGKMYIGSTISLHHRRIAHLSFLKRGKHSNCWLQKDWYTHKGENFIFETIEDNVDKEDIDDKEKHWIAFYKSNDRDFGFNIESGGRIKKSMSDETKIKLSAIATVNNKRGLDNCGSRPVVGVCVKNYDVKVFESVTSAAKFLGLSTTSGVTTVCKGKRKKVHGWRFAYILDKSKAKHALLGA